MSYEVLARKWRPRSFQHMVGQEHILRMLTNALNQNRLHHAYLFTGTRGVGKTTLARIFAKCLNCETGITSTPCGTCKNCTAVDNGRFLDLIEVDAASRTKVEDTRELLDNVAYQPAQGRYKVYLIDEVHMLSSHSFNALLKTLEEPPHYVKFLLATTDPKRLPITILSRCLQFNLKRVLPQSIASYLQHICEKESISCEPGALPLLAYAADGSMRDALSLLDQTIAYCDGKITTAETRQMLGSINQDALFELLHALSNHDGKKLLNEIEKLAEFAVDFSQALADLLSLLHRINIKQIIADAPEEDEQIIQLATCFSPEDIQLYYQIALLGQRDLPYAPSLHLGFEMVMLRMLAFQPSPKETSAPIKKAPAPDIQKTQTQPSLPAPASDNVRTWNDMLAHLGLTGMPHALAANCTLSSITDNKITLQLSVQHEPMLHKKLTDRIEQALQQHLNKPISLEIKLTSHEIDSPTKQIQQEKSILKAAATDAIKSDRDVQKIMGLFDATLDIDSIKTV